MFKTHHGSCHCGAVTYEATVDLQAQTARCNCSYCRKVRTWSVMAQPETFQVVKGEDMVTGYRFSPDRPAEHCFCSRCGVKLFGRGHVAELGGDFVTIAVATLDDASQEELVSAPVIWCDGLHDDWMNPPSEIRDL